MANNSTGKWVQRAATTGGGRTYRGQMPVNWYATLVLICVVGLFLVGLSRYQLTHKSTSSSGPPTTSQTWYAGLGINVCGTFEANLPASTNTSKTGLTANGNGVVTIHPKNSSESGSNATLGKFVSNYKGLELTNTSLGYPGKPVYTNGDVCPKGTPDSGKPGVVIVYSWPNFTSKHGAETPGDPQKLLFANGQLITMAFVPANVTIPKPPASVITNLITADQSGPTTSTTAPTSAASTVPATTPTTTPGTTSTTTASTVPTTTTAPSVTTTTKPGGSKA
jgi:hypothetical protein